MRRIVVVPQPLGPDQRDELVLGDIEIDARDRVHRAEALAQFTQRQHRQPAFPPAPILDASMPTATGGSKAAVNQPPLGIERWSATGPGQGKPKER